MEHLRAGCYDEGIALLGQALREAPNFTSAAYNIGVAAARNGDHHTAVAAYRHVYQIDPAIWQVYPRMIESLQVPGDRPARDVAAYEYFEPFSAPRLKVIEFFVNDSQGKLDFSISMGSY